MGMHRKGAVAVPVTGSEETDTSRQREKLAAVNSSLGKILRVYHFTALLGKMNCSSLR